MGTNKLALLLTVLSICAAAALSPAPAAAQLGAEGQSFDYNPDKDKTTPEVKTGAIETTYDEDAELVDSPMYGTLVLSKNRWKNWVARALYLTVINIALILMVSFLSKSDERNLIIAHVVAGASFAISFWIFLCALLLMKLKAAAWLYVLPIPLVTLLAGYAVLLKLRKSDISMSELKESFQKLKATSKEDQRLISVEGSTGDWSDQDFIK